MNINEIKERIRNFVIREFKCNYIDSNKSFREYTPEMFYINCVNKANEIINNHLEDFLKSYTLEDINTLYNKRNYLSIDTIFSEIAKEMVDNIILDVASFYNTYFKLRIEKFIEEY